MKIVDFSVFSLQVISPDTNSNDTPSYTSTALKFVSLDVCPDICVETTN